MRGNKEASTRYTTTKQYWEGEVVEVHSDGFDAIGVSSSGSSRVRFVSLANECFDLLVSANKMPNLKESVALLFKGEPEKSFIKTGIMGSNGEMTSEGREVFLTWLFEQNKTAFNEAVVQPLLKEQTKE